MRQSAYTRDFFKGTTGTESHATNLAVTVESDDGLLVWHLLPVAN